MHHYYSEVICDSWGTPDRESNFGFVIGFQPINKFNVTNHLNTIIMAKVVVIAEVEDLVK